MATKTEEPLHHSKNCPGPNMADHISKSSVTASTAKAATEGIHSQSPLITTKVSERTAKVSFVETNPPASLVEVSDESDLDDPSDDEMDNDYVDTEGNFDSYTSEDFPGAAEFARLNLNTISEPTRPSPFSMSSGANNSSIPLFTDTPYGMMYFNGHIPSGGVSTAIEADNGADIPQTNKMTTEAMYGKFRKNGQMLATPSQGGGYATHIGNFSPVVIPQQFGKASALGAARPTKPSASRTNHTILEQDRPKKHQPSKRWPQGKPKPFGVAGLPSTYLQSSQNLTAASTGVHQFFDPIFPSQLTSKPRNQGKFSLQAWDNEKKSFEFGGKAPAYKSPIPAEQSNNSLPSITRAIRCGVHGVTLEPVECGHHDGSKPLIEKNVVAVASKPNEGISFANPDSAPHSFATTKQSTLSVVGEAFVEAENPTELFRADKILDGEPKEVKFNGSGCEDSRNTDSQSEHVMAGVADHHDLGERDEGQRDLNTSSVKLFGGPLHVRMDTISISVAFGSRKAGDEESLEQVLFELRTLKEEKKLWLAEKKELRSRLEKAEIDYGMCLGEKSKLDSEILELISENEKLKEEIKKPLLLMEPERECEGE